MTKVRTSYFDIAFLLTGWLVQVLAYYFSPTGVVSLVSGLFGITSVILCSQGNIWTFFFGFGQIITYSYLCYEQRFYAGLAMNAFYFLSQIYGIYAWRKLREGESAVHITPREMPKRWFAVIVAGIFLISALVGALLSRYTTDTQPYIDALTTVASVVAQVLLVMAFREQWWIWLSVDILFVAMWLSAGNWSMVAQYIFWCINCIYGLRKWRKS